MDSEEKRRRDRERLKELARGFKFWEIVRRLVNRWRVARLSEPETDNNFEVDLSKIKMGRKKPKIVVYTCITGGYDKLGVVYKEAISSNIDYVAFLDDFSITDDGIWKKKKISTVPKIKSEVFDNKGLNRNKDLLNVFVNRYIKFHPYEIFKNDYDYAVYVDGNISILEDITPLVSAVGKKTGLALHRHRQRKSLYNEAKVCEILKRGNAKMLDQQITKYKSDGFPVEYGLYECNVIVSDLGKKEGKEILEAWWEEFVRSRSMRDQIALPYVVWKKNYKFDDVGSLGKNIFRNGLFKIDPKIHSGMKK